MRKSKTIFALPALALMLMTAVGRADTIYLKNGSVIKGKVSSFADDQFVVVLNTGSTRSTSRAMIYVGDVARIEFDSSPARTEASLSADAPQIARENQPQESKQEAGAQSAPRQATAESSPPPTPPAREPEVEKSAPQPSTSEDSASKSSRKPIGKAITVDVVAKRDWTSTGIIVKRGDRIRITATGTVTLDPNTGLTSGPEGIDAPDPKKLMPDHPTGALIAVIGADNDDFIFIGRSNEFTAARDGLLFLSVNEGTLADNIGSYKATIEVQSARGTGK
jgi:sRNA-binding regulator protein Hfq